MAWKLDLILKGHSDIKLLESYTSEREKHVRYVIKMAVRIGKIIQAPSRAIAVFRNAAMWTSELLGLEIVQKSMGLEPIGPGFCSTSASVPEKLRLPFPQPVVSDQPDGERVLMDGFLGDQFTLLTRLSVNDHDSNPLISMVKVVGPSAKPETESATSRMFDVDCAVTNWLDEVKQTQCCCVQIACHSESTPVAMQHCRTSSMIYSGIWRQRMLSRQR